MHQRQRRATLQRRVGGVRTSSSSQRRAVAHSEPGQGAFSAPVARLSKWPNNIFFASDFIADRAAATRSIRYGATRPSRATSARCLKAGPGPIERRSRLKTDPQETRLKKERITFGSSHAKRVLRQSPQGCVDDDGKKDVVVPNLDEASFMERSACALLLLHSRFFGGVKDKDDIVCCLCKLCREAGWMGKSLEERQTLDPLVVDALVAEQQRWKRSTPRSAAGRRDHSSDAFPPPKDENVTFSFEDLYRMLASIANHVYPRGAGNGRKDTRPGRAMHKLLIEGVLPLAADKRPRWWSPRPEILYGRPALAALSLQRDTLQQLYRIYDEIARADNGSRGLSQTRFLQMLADLGICPASISPTHAESVFNSAVRNGLPKANLLPRRRQCEFQGNVVRCDAGGGNVDSTELKGRSRQKSFSRQPGDERLDWSLFLEAMAALAVGAVKDGQGTPTKSDRIRPRRAQASHSRSAHCDLDIQKRHGAACKAAPGWAERPVFLGQRESHLPVQADFKFGEGNQTSARCTAPMDQATPQARGDARVEPAEGMVTAPPHGRTFFHNSQRSLELMPTLSEGGSSEEGFGLPVRTPPTSLEPESSQAREFRAKEGTGVLERTSTIQIPNPLPPEIKATVERGDPKATIKCLPGIETRGDTMPSFEARTVAPKEQKFHAALDCSTGLIRGNTTSPSTADVSIVVETGGRHEFRQGCLAPQESRQPPLRFYTSSWSRSDDVGSSVMGASSKATGVYVDIHSGAKGGTSACFKPPTSHFPSRSNRAEGKKVVSLSPAPCHGGSPSALYSPLLPAAVKRSEVATYSAPEDTVLQQAVESTVEADDADVDQSLRSLRVSSKAAERRPDWKKEGTSRIRGVDHNTGARHRGDRIVVKTQDDTGYARFKSSRKTDYADRITTVFGAAGCSTQMFEKLLEPEVVAVYSRYRKELLILFQRYRIRIVTDDHRPGSEDQDTSGYVDNPGVRRFVSDFPELRQLAEGGSFLPLIVRASRQRGRQRCDKAPLESALGLSYFGFLEVLTRMAYAKFGRQPLHAKLVDLISAIRVRGPSDVKTF